jgi:hypothetical protein
MRMNGLISERSYQPITKDDLKRLAIIAEADRVEFFTNYPGYRARVICVALCQGAALHYVNGNNGVKDFDVWTFYDRASAEKPFHPKRRKSRDFGPSKFGKMLNDLPEAKDFLGRRVDLLGRSLSVDANADPVAVLRRYLTKRESESAWWLAQKAMVLLEPQELLGMVVWPIQPCRVAYGTSNCSL